MEGQDAFRVTKAGYDEMSDIMEMSGRFFEESNYKGITSFDHDKLRSNLFMAWAGQDFVTLIVHHAFGTPVGYAHVRREDIFTKESIGELYQFYILPEYRGTGAARALRDAVAAQFADWGCALSYVECGAGLDSLKNDVLFFNLWGKIGYKFLGRALYRRGYQ